MTDNISTLIAEARDWASKAVLVGRNVIRDLDRGVANTRRLADTLEATTAERDRYRDLARRSELQCQDAEKDAARYRAALVEALAEEERCTESGTRMWRILSRALNENGAE
ncbi:MULTISPECIES: hypothetical protein [unclassified Microbacterium]|uniref:hypothetical protein n=1 Tax=unclassified Microbacterium TaxID=2609290 RepID=UPI00300FAD98